MTLEDWNIEYMKLLNCREGLRKNLFSAEFALAGDKFDEYFNHMAEKYGIEAIRQITAHSVNYRSADMRLSRNTVEWASGVELFRHYDNKSCFFSEFIVDMSPAIMNAMAGNIQNYDRELRPKHRLQRDF